MPVYCEYLHQICSVCPPGKVLCAICNKRCRGTVLKIEDHYLHKLCFKCHRCGKALDEKNFQFRDQCLYCPEDYRQEYSTKCAACGNPVEGEVVTALGSTFHTFCLRCFSCNRTISSGEKTVTLNNRFYCEKCVPPRIAQEDSTGVEEVTSNPPENLLSSSSTPPPQDLLVEPREKSPPKVKIPKSSSLPRRLGDLFRSKKSRSQTLQSTAPSTLVEESTLKNTTLTNGTDALTVNVGETDMASTDSGIGKKFDHSQSPTYSLYSGDETVLAKQQDVQTTPMEGYPVTYSTSGTPAVPYSLDAALTTPSIVNTLSGDASTLLFGSVRRICPPGVDYGHQYPVSYLRLAEQGYTAVTSSDLLSSISPLSATTTPAFIRRPPPSASASSTQRLSRRDMPSTHHSQTRTLPTSSADSTSRQGGGFMDHRYCAQVFGEVDGARPEKDRYTRYRQLSPAGSLMGRALSSGRSVGAPPNFIVRKSPESMMRSPPRVGRSVSPEAAVLAQAEARRLAAYPGAKIPDADSEPAIDRYDWPAPPSPAVVMIDRTVVILRSRDHLISSCDTVY
ncbi:Actin-binding LIM protein 2 [Echinococcus granulosus]|uniref:Actin-binding LIM protein 2 n=1 Tax=Echinococcus granulosus TaxID=6210 RepID=W6UE81_ECHGR|nr:Actin-binding LIM protein 2 [Echinococcus granulosus]EUB59730.1 Actin-binding LIM protein 2 [Echinococcus granulosus]